MHSGRIYAGNMEGDEVHTISHWICLVTASSNGLKGANPYGFSIGK